LRSAGEIEFGFLKKRSLDFEARVDGISGIFRDERTEERRSHAGVKILADFKSDFDFFRERKGKVLGDLVVGCVEARECFEIWRNGF